MNAEQAPTVKFTGTRRGRPLFDFGDYHVAPRWLVEAIDKGRIRVSGASLIVGGREVAPGEEVSEQ